MSLITHSNCVKGTEISFNLSPITQKDDVKGDMWRMVRPFYVVVYAPAHYPPRVALGLCRGGKGEKHKGRAAIQ